MLASPRRRSTKDIIESSKLTVVFAVDRSISLEGRILTLHRNVIVIEDADLATVDTDEGSNAIAGTIR